MRDIGVYVHIPFCKSKCYYCDFISFANKESLIKEYIEAVICEIKNADLSKYNVKTIYIGGGTPSIINTFYIKEILQEINIKNEAEVTIEINPGTVDEAKLQEYINSGVNRLSIGLQSTDNILLKKIRKNPYI